jgi:penicillin V acylase-like amidase (Ntn superfamily)
MKALFLFLSFFSQFEFTFACSAYFLKNKVNSIAWVGKNYDWSSDHGALFTNPRGLNKINTHPNSKVEFNWTSKYGSLTFSQFGKEFPLSGINEKKLVVEVLWLTSSLYPTAIIDKPILNELQWIQYILDTSSNLTEAISQAEKVEISPLYAKVHYFVCDQTECATIEYLNHRIVITKTSFHVLTNSDYQSSVQNLKKYKGFGGNQTIPHSYDSNVRFANLAQITQTHFNPSQADIMNGLDLVKSTTSTQWQIIYNLNESKIYFRTKNFQSLKEIDLNIFFNPQDLSCRSNSKILEMNQNKIQIQKEDLSNWTHQLNKELILKNIILSSDLQKIAYEYPDLYTSCVY